MAFPYIDAEPGAYMLAKILITAQWHISPKMLKQWLVETGWTWSGYESWDKPAFGTGFTTQEAIWEEIALTLGI